MGTRVFCLCCGLEDPKHKKGCEQYRAALSLAFNGDIKKIFAASDNGLLPQPPWINPISLTENTHPWEDRARQLRADGLMWTDIADKLNEEGFTTIGGKRIEASRILNRIWYSNRRAK